ncbi:MAG: hypothetical protein H6Q74_1742 [Firmicutes bacterium]|nr:hypothetical protein [Bacillota bacterium]
MKKIVWLTLVLMVMFTAVVCANGIYDAEVVWTDVPNESLSGITYAYAPEFTSISPTGRLATVIKTTQPNGYTTIEKIYVNSSFDQYIVVACGKFKQDGSTIKIVPDADKAWRQLLPATLQDQCLQTAYQYAKTKQ